MKQIEFNLFQAQGEDSYNKLDEALTRNSYLQVQGIIKVIKAEINIGDMRRRFMIYHLDGATVKLEEGITGNSLVSVWGSQEAREKAYFTLDKLVEGVKLNLIKNGG